MSMYNQEKIDEILWIAHSLYNRGLVHGCTGNISFCDNEYIYISKSGSCFGRLKSSDFSILDRNGEIIKGIPSKEYPLHLSLYAVNKKCQVIIHTHSYYTTLLTCQTGSVECAISRLLKRTPYLAMKTKQHIGHISYYPPGSKDLFDAFDKEKDEKTNVYLMERHGLLVGEKDGISAMDIIEEMEMAARLDYDIRKFQ